MSFFDTNIGKSLFCNVISTNFVYFWNFLTNVFNHKTGEQKTWLTIIGSKVFLLQFCDKYQNFGKTLGNFLNFTLAKQKNTKFSQSLDFLMKNNIKEYIGNNIGK